MTNFDFLLLAQEFDGGDAGAAGAAGLIPLLIQLAIVVLVVAGLWKVFTKAGQPGWAAIIPIYNMIVVLQIVGRPIWWIILLIIPCINIFVLLVVYIDLAKSFGKGVGFAIGLWLLSFIFIPILGFGDAKYQGPSVTAA